MTDLRRSPIRMARPMLFWALLHAAPILYFFHGGLTRSLASVPGMLHAPLWIGFAVEAMILTFAVWLISLPLLATGRWYAWLAPLVVGVASTLLYLDSVLYDSLGFHFNGLILEVAFQPGALDTTGLSTGEVAAYLGGALALLVVDVVAGNRFVRRFTPTLAGAVFSPPRARAWPWAAAVVVLWVAERLAVGAMTFYGGHAVLAAGTTLPLQPPVRMAGFMERLTGKTPMYGEILVRDLPQAGSAMGEVDPAQVKFTRKPDVLFMLIESTRSDFFLPEVMPNLTRRAEEGRVFPLHYSSAPSTHFALFSLFFGLDAQRRDAILGAGRAPLLFPALKANGYATSLIASSTVDWMDLRGTVFRDVEGDLQTGLPGATFELRDASMIERAKAVVRDTPADQPLFLFLFFNGTHFNYSYPERSAVFAPAWDGEGSLKATTVDADLLKNRSKNSLHEVDWKLEEFLEFYEGARGGKPLLMVTADHGEEFREHGRVGHGSDVTREQIHVPLVIVDEEMPAGIHRGVTGHVDLVPTIFSLLGDGHDPSLYSDGLPVQSAPPGRHALATIGWEPRFAVIGEDIKVRFYSLDAGLGSVQVTDPDDRQLPDGRARFAASGSKILQRLKGGLGQREGRTVEASAGAE